MFLYKAKRSINNILSNTEWSRLIVLWLVLRIFYSLIVGFLIVGEGIPNVPDWDTGLYKYVNNLTPQSSPFERVFLAGWLRWDTGYFIKIAAQGYSSNDGTTAFGPLYPFLIGLLTPGIGTGNYLFTALIISNIFVFITIILFYITAKQELGSESVAFKALLVFVSFPTSFFLFAAYPESLFFTLVFACYLIAKKGRWWIAGIIASLAVLTRFQGVTLFIMLAVYSTAPLAANLPNLLHQLNIRKIVGRERASTQKLLMNWSILSSLLPVFTYLFFHFWVTQKYESVSISAYAAYWNNPIIAPWKAIQFTMLRISNGYLSIYDVTNLSALLMFMVLAFMGLRKLRPALSLYSLLTLGIVAWLSLGRLSVDPIHGQLLASFARYVLSLFPLFFILADILNSRIKYIIYFLFSLSIQTIFLYAYTHWFFVS